MSCVRSNCLSSNCKKTHSGSKDKGVRKLELVAKTQFLFRRSSLEPVKTVAIPNPANEERPVMSLISI